MRQLLRRIGGKVPNAYFLAHVIKDAMSKLRLLPLPGQTNPGDSADILHIARQNYATSNAISGEGLPDFGNRWGAFKTVMASRIATFKDAAEAIRFAQTEGNFDHRTRITPATMNNILVADHLIRYEYPGFASVVDDVRESQSSTGGTVVEFRRGGKNALVSNIQYFHMFHLLSMFSFDREIHSCCEVGGGYGDLARLCLTNPTSKVKQYCIVDIPESLFFSEVFLRSCLPGARFIYVTAHDFDLHGIEAQGGQTVILCPVQCHTATRQLKFDLVINTGSMAEMTDEWVSFWGAWLDQQQARYFYSHNYFGNPVDRIFEGRSCFAPVVSDRWEVGFLRPMHPLMMLQGAERKAAEIIFVNKGKAAAVLVDAPSCFKAMITMKFGLYEFILFAYSFLRNRNIVEEIEFVDKVRADFGYDPVELVSILGRITTHEQFRELDSIVREKVNALSKELSERYARNFPTGTQDT